MCVIAKLTSSSAPSTWRWNEIECHARLDTESNQVLSKILIDKSRGEPEIQIIDSGLMCITDLFQNKSLAYTVNKYR